MPQEPSVFECHKCGQCCEGKGGIVLSSGDLDRLAAYLGQDSAQVVREYAEICNGKIRIRAGGDGRCVFFRAGAGCVVHEAKPSVCRAWPFFRGNLEDQSSFAMAREYCPGIARDVAFEDFGRAGLAYLREHGLFASDARAEANALIISDRTKR